LGVTKGSSKSTELLYFSPIKPGDQQNRLILWLVPFVIAI
jgi:hypothetical protein